MIKSEEFIGQEKIALDNRLIKDYNIEYHVTPRGYRIISTYAIAPL